MSPLLLVKVNKSSSIDGIGVAYVHVESIRTASYVLVASSELHSGGQQQGESRLGPLVQGFGTWYIQADDH